MRIVESSRRDFIYHKEQLYRRVREEDDSENDTENDSGSTGSEHSSPEIKRRFVTRPNPVPPSRYARGNGNSQKIQRRQVKTEANSSSLLMAVVICILCIVVPSLCWISYSNGNNDSDSVVLEKLKKQMSAVRTVFPEQDLEMWNNIILGILQTLDKPEKPSIFLLFADSKEPMECLAQTIGDMSRQVLGSQTILVVEPESLGTDYGIAVNKIRPRAEASKAVVSAII